MGHFWGALGAVLGPSWAACGRNLGACHNCQRLLSDWRPPPRHAPDLLDKSTASKGSTCPGCEVCRARPLQIQRVKYEVAGPCNYRRRHGAAASGGVAISADRREVPKHARKEYYDLRVRRRLPRNHQAAEHPRDSCDSPCPPEIHSQQVPATERPAPLKPSAEMHARTLP